MGSDGSDGSDGLKLCTHVGRGTQGSVLEDSLDRGAGGQAPQVRGSGRATPTRGTSRTWCGQTCATPSCQRRRGSHEQALARKGRKGWASQGSELASVNLRGRKEVLKQESWNTRKVWWAPILTRGKLHVVLFDEEFPGETPAGAGALDVRFPNAATKPSCVFVDRGKGFYHPASGKITPTFKKALGEGGFTAFWGDDASVQPGHLQELMLHETAVSWLRVRLERTLPSACWRETTEAFGTRLRACCADVTERQSGGGGLVQGLPQEGAVAAGPGGRAPEGVSARVRPNWAPECMLNTVGKKALAKSYR